MAWRGVFLQLRLQMKGQSEVNPSGSPFCSDLEISVSSVIVRPTPPESFHLLAAVPFHRIIPSASVWPTPLEPSGYAPLLTGEHTSMSGVSENLPESLSPGGCKDSPRWRMYLVIFIPRYRNNPFSTRDGIKGINLKASHCKGCVFDM